MARGERIMADKGQTGQGESKNDGRLHQEKRQLSDTAICMVEMEF